MPEPVSAEGVGWWHYDDIKKIHRFRSNLPVVNGIDVMGDPYTVPALVNRILLRKRCTGDSILIEMQRGQHLAFTPKNIEEFMENTTEVASKAEENQARFFKRYTCV